MPAQSALSEHATAKRVSVPELARTFLIFGLIGFGGPAAHIALMERELVVRRKWLTHEHFLNLLAAINLVPGPTSTEMAFYIGQVMGGFWGGVASGLSFILPAVLMSIALAVIYVAAGTVPAIAGLLLGVKPVVLVVILSAAYRLGLKAIDNRAMRLLLGLALFVIVFTIAPFMGLFGLPAVRVPELLILLATGLLYVGYRRRRLTPMIMIAPMLSLGAQALSGIKPGVLDLFGRFLLIGATLFGSGYVLVSYMERNFIHDTGWMNAQQLIDTLAMGQVTPGPLSSTAAAAGYVMTATRGDPLSGIPGAAVSAVGVFLPAFFIVLFLGRLIPVLHRYTVIMDFLKGVNAGVIALLIGSFISLAWGTLVRADASLDWLSLILTGLAFFGLERLKWSPVALIAIGAVIGLIRAALKIL
jgi:chromate transporter